MSKYFIKFKSGREYEVKYLEDICKAMHKNATAGIDPLYLGYSSPDIQNEADFLKYITSTRKWQKYMEETNENTMKAFTEKTIREYEKEAFKAIERLTRYHNIKPFELRKEQ